MKNLREIEAVRREKNPETKHWDYFLTPLGYHVSQMPVDVRIGKVGPCPPPPLLPSGPCTDRLYTFATPQTGRC
jgi:hypothetical protein